MGTLVFQANLGGAVNLIGPNTASTVNFTLPSADGTNGQAMVTNGSGTLSFATISTAAATPTALGTVYGKMTTAGASPYLTALGYNAGAGNTTGTSNTAVGVGALQSNTAGSQHTAVGYQALNAQASATSAGSTAFGYQAGLNYNNADAVGSSVFVGFWAGKTTSTGTDNTFVGGSSGQLNTTGGYNAGLGGATLQVNTTGSYNTAVGMQALRNNTTASYNTAVGYQAAYSSNSTGGTYLGYQTGYSTTSGTYNTFVGYQSGYLVTTGAKNVILGGYNGNQGSLDIRTASNYIVLSDGDGNPRGIFNNSGNFLVGTTTNGAGIGWSTKLAVDASGTFGMVIKTSLADYETMDSWNSATSGTRYHIIFRDGSAATMQGNITTNGSSTSYNTTSDYRLKHDIAPMTSALAKVAALKPVTYKWNSDDSNGEGFIAHELAEVCPQAVIGKKDAVDEKGNPKYQSIDTSFLVATLTAAIQELKSELDAAKTEIETLKGQV